jgi:hypothetical protein
MIFRVLLIFAFVISTISEITAQTDNERYWSEGPLRWSDFTIRDDLDHFTYQFRYSLEYNPTKYKQNDTVIRRIMAEAYMERNHSLVNPAYMNDAGLQYNQVLFDIVEYHRRSLQRELDLSGNPYYAAQILGTIHSMCEEAIDDVKVDTYDGYDSAKVKLWKAYMDDKLDELPVSRTPKIVKRNFGYALFGGMSTGIMTGDLADYFKPSAGIYFGFDFGYKKAVLFLFGNLAWTGFRSIYEDGQEWTTDNAVRLAIIDISMGYTLFDASKLKITPFAGLGITEFSQPYGPSDNRKTSSMDSKNAVFGCNFDLKLRKAARISFTGSFGGREYVETIFRFRVYSTRVIAAPDLMGYTMNIGIVIGAFGNLLRVE